MICSEKLLNVCKLSREVCIRDDEVFAFNKLLRELKMNNEFFAFMQAAKLTLITNQESQLCANNGAVDQ
jgi:hypothetical protein